MAEGRNRRIAAWAFIAAMALGPCEAVALDLDQPSSSPIQTPALSALPALPSISIPSLTSPSPVPVLVQPTEAPSPVPAQVPAPSPGTPATTGAPAHSSRALGERGGQTAGRGVKTGVVAAPVQTGKSRSRALRRARRARTAHPRRAKRNVLLTLEHSRFGRLGELVQAGAPASALSDFPAGPSGSGLGWALPLLAIMLPIGLCGFLRAGRQSREG
jgi:hypothetical protein